MSERRIIRLSHAKRLAEHEAKFTARDILVCWNAHAGCYVVARESEAPRGMQVIHRERGKAWDDYE